MLGEVSTQYGGTGPDDPKLGPSYALAEELDIPVAIHMGLDPPGTSYLAQKWLGKSGQCVKWSFCLKVARMAVEQER